MCEAFLDTFNSFEEASAGGNVDDNEASGVRVSVLRKALEWVETTKKILDMEAQAVRTAIQETEESENTAKNLSMLTEMRGDRVSSSTQSAQ